MIIVIGGEGFIGSYICNELEKRGLPYQSLDIKTGFDVRDESAVKEAIKDSELIFNLASVVGVENVEKNPIGCIETNVIGVRNILKYKKGKLIYFSTSEVNGKMDFQLSEDNELLVQSPGELRWSYQVSKLCAEHLIIAGDPNSLIIRPFNVFGKGQSLAHVIPRFILWALKNEDIHIYNGGLQTRTWMHIDDFIDAVFAIINKNGIYNVGGEEVYTTIELAETIIKLSNSKSKLIFDRGFRPEVECRFPNLNKLKETGWYPKRNFQEKIQKLVSSCRHGIVDTA